MENSYEQWLASLTNLSTDPMTRAAQIARAALIVVLRNEHLSSPSLSAAEAAYDELTKVLMKGP